MAVEWIVAEEASFVVSETLHTPISSGIVAFRDISDATSKATEANGKLKQWKETLAPVMQPTPALPRRSFA